VLRRSKIFIATGIQIAVSSVGAAYDGQHLHTQIYIHIVFAVQGRQNPIRRVGKTDFVLSSTVCERRATELMTEATDWQQFGPQTRSGRISEATGFYGECPEVLPRKDRTLVPVTSSKICEIGGICGFNFGI
jgi:hypothetical protein